MNDTTRLDGVRVAGHEDRLPVFSRVSWGALMAGLFVALTVFLVLSALGAAVGLSVADRASGDSIAVGAGIWAIVTGLVAFFCGGCVTSRCTAGESRTEAAIYGTILWGLTVTLLLWVSGSAVRTGFSAVVGSTNVTTATPPPATWEEAARRTGLTDEQVTRLRAELPSEGRVRAASAEAAWWSLAGILASLAAAIGGALVGSGPNPRFGLMFFRRADPAPAQGTPDRAAAGV